MKLRHAIWFLLVIPYIISAQQQAPVASIRGTVVDSASGAPIADAELRLSKPGQPVRRATTDAGGVFGFTDLEAGLYAMSATRAGYLEQAYGNSPDWQFRSDARDFVITGGQALQAPIRMLRAATISGRVYDTNRAPVANARMSLGVLLRRPTAAILQSPQNIPDPNLYSVLTNDRGEYRMTGIPPGEYYVSAAESATIDGRLQINNSARTFYPGFRNPERSSPIKVASGAEIVGIDFPLEPVSSLKVSGRIVNSLFSGGQENRDHGYTYLLTPRNARINDATGPANTSLPDHATSPDEFEFWSIAPGIYDLYIAYRVGRQDPRGADTYYMGRSVVDVSDRDVSGLTVTIEPGVDIAGRFVLDDAAKTLVPDIRSLSVSFQSMSTMSQMYSPGLGRASTVQADGTFVLSHAIAGQYLLVALMNPNLNLYVSSARLGARDITNQIFEVDANSSGPLVIEISGLAGKFEGTVTDRDNNPASRARVVLAPSITVRDPTAYKTVSTDTEGRFTVAGVRPGTYMVYAFDAVSEGAWFDPQFMAPHSPFALSIDVSRGSQTRKDLKLIRVQ